MTEVMIGEDCGNSPRNIFVQELTIAFAKGNVRVILDQVTEGVRWNIVGDTLIEGKDNLSRALKNLEKAETLTIHHITTHGKAGAVNGTRTLSSGKTLGFCDVYEFSNTKASAVKEITSYVIEIR